MSADDEGGFRSDDPETSIDAARSFQPGPIMIMILEYLARLQEPRNGWEMSKALDMATITVVPRLAPMYRREWIVCVGTRPGPSDRGQRAYVITSKGRRVLADLQQKDK